MARIVPTAALCADAGEQVCAAARPALRTASERGYWTTAGFAITSDVPGVVAGMPAAGIA